VSLEKALKALENLGLTKMDAQIYAYLEKKGPHAEKDLLSALKTAKNQLHLSLKNLIDKEMITCSAECSTKYCAIPLEKVLEKFLQTAIKEVEDLQVNRQTILEAWRSANAQS
jgi:sugar-specific transcriptional regulator TrmB